MMRGSVVVTGASAGIGRATAMHLQSAGYHVVNIDRTGADCRDFANFTLDMCDHAALSQALGEISDKFEVTGLVNNAGLARTAALEDTDDAHLSATFDINLTAAAICARELVPAMKRRGYGRIVNISSRSALGRELRTAYAASKGGLIAMTRVWALELGAAGITANCVAPGPVATGLFDQMNPDGSERRQKMVRDIPVGRMGAPADIANAVHFFMSPDSGFVNGQTLYVCGGLSAGVAPL
ncbi:SDR family NAD(P)-dependent oxidoreductase [Stappia sp.]|uniref:SDR family NAD(P)-dependent oxidoreductase n=1 Tax=Stappia sp. TaxID=1870903 RepID=UPI003A99C019